MSTAVYSTQREILPSTTRLTKRGIPTFRNKKGTVGCYLLRFKVRRDLFVPIPSSVKPNICRWPLSLICPDAAALSNHAPGGAPGQDFGPNELWSIVIILPMLLLACLLLAPLPCGGRVCSVPVNFGFRPISYSISGALLQSQGMKWHVRSPIIPLGSRRTFRLAGSSFFLAAIYLSAFLLLPLPTRIPTRVKEQSSRLLVCMCVLMPNPLTTHMSKYSSAYIRIIYILEVYILPHVFFFFLRPVQK